MLLFQDRPCVVDLILAPEQVLFLKPISKAIDPLIRWQALLVHPKTMAPLRVHVQLDRVTTAFHFEYAATLPLEAIGSLSALRMNSGVAAGGAAKRSIPAP
jgi:hypothetical protein